MIIAECILEKWKPGTLLALYRLSCLCSGNNESMDRCECFTFSLVFVLETMRAWIAVNALPSVLSLFWKQ